MMPALAAAHERAESEGYVLVDGQAQSVPAAVSAALKTGSLADLNGSFAAILGDVAVTDRLGSVPVYLAAGRPSFDFWSLADQQRTLNLDAAAEMLLFGYALGDGTLLKEITEAPPASVIIPGREPSRYWRYNVSPSSSSGRQLSSDLAHVIELIGRNTATALKAQGLGRVGLNLTAGRDSRVLAALLRRNSVPFVAYTMEDQLGEHEVAGVLAEQLGVAHFVRPVWRSLPAEAQPIIDQLTPTTMFTVANTNLVHAGETRRIDALMSGHLGDVAAGSHLHMSLIVASLANDRPGLARRAAAIQTRFDPAILKPYCTPALAKALDRAVERLVTMYRERDAGELFGAVTAVDLEQRQRRFILRDFHAQRQLGPAIMPFADNAWFDFWTSVPLRWQAYTQLYTRVLAEHVFTGELSAFAEIPANGKRLSVVRLPELETVRSFVSARFRKGSFRQPDAPRLIDPDRSLDGLADMFDVKRLDRDRATMPQCVQETLETLALFAEKANPTGAM